MSAHLNPAWGARTTPAWWWADDAIGVKVALVMTEVKLVDGCLVWQSQLSSEGYPVIGQNYVHRLMFSWSHRALLEREYVLHSCDNRACINPAHLRAGSHLDNIQDARQKGRMRNNPIDGRFVSLAVTA